MPPQRLGCIRGDDTGGVVAAETGDVASGVSRAAAEIETGHGSAVVARAGERAVPADLAVREGADEQIAAAHIGQGALGIER